MVEPATRTGSSLAHLQHADLFIIVSDSTLATHVAVRGLGDLGDLSVARLAQSTVLSAVDVLRANCGNGCGKMAHMQLHCFPILNCTLNMLYFLLYPGRQLLSG